MVDRENLERRQQLLRSKLQANAQRNARRFYLTILPPSLGEYLQTCQFITSPEMDQLLPHFWMWEEGVDPLPSEVEYKSSELSWHWQIFGMFAEFGSEFDRLPAYFYPHGDCPIFCTSLGWVRQNIEILFSLPHATDRLNSTYRPDRLGMIATNSAAGLVIGNYCGYVPNDPNPDEVVYTVTMWKSRLDLSKVK
jgi:hypothetical protein